MAYLTHFSPKISGKSTVMKVGWVSQVWVNCPKFYRFFSWGLPFRGMHVHSISLLQTTYIEFVADRLLLELGCEKHYKVSK